MSLDLHNIRQEYSKQSLSEQDCANSPFEQFQRWLHDAVTAQVNEPTAMNIATIDPSGRPSARIVLLKEVTEHGFVFFTNYLSRKGLALNHHPFAALTFFWPELERQIRIEGSIEKIPQADSERYFQSRPYTSRIGAWASQQSSVIPSKSVIITQAALISAKHPLHVPKPPHWGGYIVLPDNIEFWQGRPSRLHDRIRYRLDQHQWIRERLAP